MTLQNGVMTKYRGPGRPEAAGTCMGCGKMVYLTRKAAKAAARVLYPGDHLSEYACVTEGGRGWHIGHLPPHVMRGTALRGMGTRDLTG